MSQDNAAKIRLSGVRKTFAGGKKVVLDHVDLEIGKGESVVIIGGSGTGKSVTIKCMLGLLKPDSGSITIDGKEVTTMSASDNAFNSGVRVMLDRALSACSWLRLPLATSLSMVACKPDSCLAKAS